MKTIPGRIALLLALVTCSAAVSAQTLYRCTGADGKVMFQDRPCSGASTETKLNMPSAAQGKVRARSFASLTEAEKKSDWPALLSKYHKTFQVLGRAKKCGFDQDYSARLADFRRELEYRHGESDPGGVVLQGVSAGMNTQGMSPGSVKPCPETRMELASLTLPAVPERLVLRDGGAGPAAPPRR